MANDLLSLDAITKQAVKLFKESQPLVNQQRLADYYLQRGLLQQAIAMVTGGTPPTNPAARKTAIEVVEKAKAAQAELEAKATQYKEFVEGDQWVYNAEQDKVVMIPGPRENMPFPKEPSDETVYGKSLRIRLPNDYLIADTPRPVPVEAKKPLRVQTWPPKRELIFDDDEVAPPARNSGVRMMVAYGHMLYRPTMNYGIVCEAR